MRWWYPGFACWISLVLVFSFMYCWVLIFDLSPFCVLIYMFLEIMHDGLGVFRAGWAFVWLDPILGWGEVGAMRLVWALQWSVFAGCSRRALLTWIIYVFLSCVCCAFVRACKCVPCGRLLGVGGGGRLASWLSFVESDVSLSLSHWYPGSGVVLDCIDSWSLHPTFFYYTVS